jgi:hypothetical protein
MHHEKARLARVFFRPFLVVPQRCMNGEYALGYKALI